MSTIFFEKVVLQPTSLCNLNCSYCYLPGRTSNFKMLPEVADKIAESISCVSNHVSVIWHGGEPLSCGLDHFKRLVEPFDSLRKEGKVTHFIQTNGTLINNRFCEFFRDYDFQVGVSIDGPEWANNVRVDWKGSSTYSHVMKGIGYLKAHNIPFNIIAVVSGGSIDRAKEIYEYFCDIECKSLAFNIEEREGVNDTRLICGPDEVRKFWSEMFDSWQKKPVINIREFRQALSWIKAVIDHKTQQYLDHEFDYFPSVSWQGDVVVLSPEFLDTASKCYDNFIVGNVLKKTLTDIVASSANAKYVTDFKDGIELCSLQCEYYSFCQGGQASNKFFELGSVKGTQTMYCLNSKKLLIEAIISNFN